MNENFFKNVVFAVFFDLALLGMMLVIEKHELLGTFIFLAGALGIVFYENKPKI